MNAGELRSRITLRAATVVDTATGGQTTTWANEVDIWARVRLLSGTEAVLVGAIQGQLYYELAIRHRTGVGPQSRVTWEGRTLEVTAVLPDERRQWLRLMARQERVATT